MSANGHLPFQSIEVFPENLALYTIGLKSNFKAILFRLCIYCLGDAGGGLAISVNIAKNFLNMLIENLLSVYVDILQLNLELNYCKVAGTSGDCYCGHSHNKRAQIVEMPYHSRRQLKLYPTVRFVSIFVTN